MMMTSTWSSSLLIKTDMLNLYTDLHVLFRRNYITTTQDDMCKLQKQQTYNITLSSAYRCAVASARLSASRTPSGDKVPKVIGLATRSSSPTNREATQNDKHNK